MPRRPSVTFVIMAGGKGERLWPLVTSRRPKVCLAPDGRTSLLAATIQRLRASWPGAKWLIVTTRDQAAAVRAAVPASMRRAVLQEPEGKNTAACVTLAAATVVARDPDGVMVVVPADHWIGDLAEYRRVIRAGIHAAARHDTLAMIGIRPTSPHTGFGYLCAGRPVSVRSRPRVRHLDRFVEKPTAAAARRLLRRPNTYWNSGTFIGTAETFLTAVFAWLPDHAKHLVPAPRGARLVRAYRRVPAISFDHGVMDHLHEGLVVPGHFAWADLGTWDSWSRLASAGASAVPVRGANVSVVSLQPHLVATVGVSNIVVVHTPSATLVCAADQAQAVREVVQRLRGSARLAAYR